MIVVLLAVGIFLNSALSNYGYDRIIYELKASSIFLLSVGAVVVSIIFIVKKLPKKEVPTIVKKPRPKRKFPEIKLE
ncbi:hypothetical protein ACFLYT_01855, partial [Nanoarchaeota archaeon]